ncbi:MAG: hypothetical protein F4066_06330 [Chloroflexi bacterium]|nr:hypothetical protein [Chloroflexota bacterium]MYF80436.1 hypothetical protein [Chloroflexota bacterium]MYI04462.1 hypothetical protein [Chloroflexota bacterium]
MTTQAYEEGSMTLLEQALTELAAGEVRQASEKGWGSAALAIKALCERRGWNHGRHRDLFVTVDRLVDETGDQEIDTLFASANMLHVNFYENHEGAAKVAQRLERVQLFIDKLDALP